MDKEKLYNCTDYNECKEYEQIAYEIYRYYPLKVLRRYQFILKTEIEKKILVDSFAIVPILISMGMIFVNDAVNEKLWIVLGEWTFVLKMILIAGIYSYVITLWGKGHSKQQKRISMIKTEKYIIEQLLEKKQNELNKSKVQARRVHIIKHKSK